MSLHSYSRCWLHLIWGTLRREKLLHSKARIQVAGYFLDTLAESNNRGKMYLSKRAMNSLLSYHWPGNIRELKNVIEKAVIFSPTNIIHEQDISIPVKASRAPIVTVNFHQAKQNVIEKFEKEFVIGLLERNEWNISKAANEAEKDRRSIQRILRKYHIESPNQIFADR